MRKGRQPAPRPIERYVKFRTALGGDGRHSNRRHVGCHPANDGEVCVGVCPSRIRSRSSPNDVPSCKERRHLVRPAHHRRRHEWPCLECRRLPIMAQSPRPELAPGRRTSEGESPEDGVQAPDMKAWQQPRGHSFVTPGLQPFPGSARPRRSATWGGTISQVISSKEPRAWRRCQCFWPS